MKKLLFISLFLIFVASAFSQTINELPIEDYLQNKKFLKITILESNNKSYAMIDNGTVNAVDADIILYKNENKMFFNSAIDIANYLSEFNYTIISFNETYNKYGFRTVCIMKKTQN